MNVNNVRHSFMILKIRHFFPRMTAVIYPQLSLQLSVSTKVDHVQNLLTIQRKCFSSFIFIFLPQAFEMIQQIFMSFKDIIYKLVYLEKN